MPSVSCGGGGGFSTLAVDPEPERGTMSDKPEITALQVWILQAQREILLKGSAAGGEPVPRSDPQTA
jgi:hypothetical protein